MDEIHQNQEETYRRLCELAGRLQIEMKRLVFQSTKRYGFLWRLENSELVTDLAGTMELSDEEAFGDKEGTGMSSLNSYAEESRS
jgi:hypothetical protein